ncbi:ogr/Delta-like zinc finger family protein [Serratia marcescens]|nr:ogr/Delta-like zinc finger family protein [Serratia marcescens]MBN5204541.1 ogr/Delta-like zinc finger family protein [Serratia marcescens]
MMKCPCCCYPSHIRTSRYITHTVKESYYQCQNISCSSTFKTIETLDKLISSPNNISNEQLGMDKQID